MRKNILNAVACATLLAGGLSYTPFIGAQSSESVGESDLVTLNLQDVDIRVLINTVAEVSQKNFVIDPRVKGKVSVISGKQLDRSQLYDVFLSILQVHNFAAIESGGLTKIVPSNVVKQLPTPTKYTAVTKASDRQVTQVLKLENSSVQEIVPIIRPLIPPTSHFAAHAPSNTLIVTDVAANIKRVLEIIERIDVPSTQSSVHVVYLDKANASELAGIINQMLPSLNSKVSAKKKGAGAGNVAQRVNIQAQPSINALIINASDEDYATINEVISQLDIDRPVEGNVHVIRLKHAKASDLVSVISEVTKTATTGAGGQGGAAGNSGTLSIQADESTNSLVVNANAQEFRTIQTVIDKLDVRRAQVYIETIIAEVTVNQAAELGINLTANPTLVSRNNPNQVLGSIQAGSNFASAATEGLTYSLLNFDKFRLNAVLKALRSDTNSNILSTPTILTLDNEPAEILVGQEVPFITGQFTNNSSSSTNTNSNGSTNTSTNPFQTIERRDVGIKLNITPQINDGDTIQLEVKQEISNVTPSPIASDLITNRRAIEAVVQVDDGQVIVLGGLIQDDVDDSITKVPLLGDIPVVGALFRRKTKKAVKRNLMVFLKPRIIRSAKDLSDYSEDRYQDVRVQSKIGQPDTKYMIHKVKPAVLKEYKDVIDDGRIESERSAKERAEREPVTTFTTGGTENTYQYDGESPSERDYRYRREQFGKSESQ